MTMNEKAIEAALDAYAGAMEGPRGDSDVGFHPVAMRAAISAYLDVAATREGVAGAIQDNVDASDCVMGIEDAASAVLALLRGEAG